MLLYTCALVVIELICRLSVNTRIAVSPLILHGVRVFAELNAAMATYNISLQTPGAFRFDRPDEWAKWKRRFEQFRLVSGLSAQSKERQVCTLLYTLGEDAEDVLSSTNISQEDRKKYAEVMAKFDGFFQIRKNVIYERARFNRRVQQPDELVEQFITNLYHLAEHCEYGELRNEMIRDRIVVGIRDSALSEGLQLDPELTLEKAKKLVRQREAVHEQQQFLSQNPNDAGTMVAAVSKSSEVKQPNRKPPRSSSSRPPQQRRQQVCTRCGRGTHSRQVCPAKEATCHKCNKKGHYSSIAILSQFQTFQKSLILSLMQ